MISTISRFNIHHHTAAFFFSLWWTFLKLTLLAILGNSLAIQPLGFTFVAKGLCSIPGQGTKIPQASQFRHLKKKKKKKVLLTIITCFTWHPQVILFNLFLTALCHCGCVQAFSGCGKWRLRLTVECRLLVVAASLLAEHRLQACGLQ